MKQNPSFVTENKSKNLFADKKSSGYYSVILV